MESAPHAVRFDQEQPPSCVQFIRIQINKLLVSPFGDTNSLGSFLPKLTVVSVSVTYEQLCSYCNYRIIWIVKSCTDSVLKWREAETKCCDFLFFSRCRIAITQIHNIFCCSENHNTSPPRIGLKNAFWLISAVANYRCCSDECLGEILKQCE